jgi:hypothetical protein
MEKRKEGEKGQREKKKGDFLFLTTKIPPG